MPTCRNIHLHALVFVMLSLCQYAKKVCQCVRVCVDSCYVHVKERYGWYLKEKPNEFKVGPPGLCYELQTCAADIIMLTSLLTSGPPETMVVFAPNNALCARVLAQKYAC